MAYQKTTEVVPAAMLAEALRRPGLTKAKDISDRFAVTRSTAEKWRRAALIEGRDVKMREKHRQTLTAL